MALIKCIAKEPRKSKKNSSFKSEQYIMFSWWYTLHKEVSLDLKINKYFLVSEMIFISFLARKPGIIHQQLTDKSQDAQ